MRSYFFRNRAWFRWVYREAIWSLPTQQKKLYLTFDDGPVPEVTPYVLDLLSAYQAKATFFCVGENVQKHPDIVMRAAEEGHAIGNHTYHHLNGWKTEAGSYMENVERCNGALGALNLQTKLFRPPYGNITCSQLNTLKRESYQIFMWSHLAGDFDPNLKVAKSFHSLQAATGGSVLVFHDSVKACHNLRQLLPQVLDHFSTLGYSFMSLNTL